MEDDDSSDVYTVVTRFIWNEPFGKSVDLFSVYTSSYL